MRLLFTHSYFRQFDPKQIAHAQPYPPIATLIAAAYLRENKHDVHFFDTMFSNSANDIKTSLDKINPQVLIIYDDGFNYLTKMCLSNMRDAAFEMIQLAKKNQIKVIVASSDATDHSQKYLDAGADFIIIGEGEDTLLELIKTLEIKNEEFDEINGLHYLKDNKVLKTKNRLVSKNLDKFPLPAWDLLDIKPYKDVWINKHHYFSINVATTRGCPYKCNWCAKPIYGNAYNMRSAEKVVEELVLLKNLFDYDHVWFCDDIFGLKRSWVNDFSRLIKKAKLEFKYKIQSRADLLVQEQYVDDLASSGCDDVWMGAESGSQSVLDAMDKGTTVDEIIKARQLLKEKKIKASFFIQFGYPGEKLEDIEKTIHLIIQNMPDDIGISVSYPLPGTAFYEKVKNELSRKTNWTDSNELALMFKNTYQPEFYKQLHHYVHQVYRLKKANITISEFRDLKSVKKIIAYPYLVYACKKSLAILKKTESNVSFHF